MANYRRRSGVRPGRKTEINMIPFLDVLLTLLLIFMIAAPAVNSSIDVTVPNSSVAKATTQAAEKDIVVVEVHGADSYTLLFNAQKYTALDQNTLQAQLNQVLQGKDLKNLIVQVAADKGAMYDNVVQALTILKAYGIVDVGLITNPSSSSN
ncbi:biopolymer transporter ExbD [Psittacicella gerlachiana]|uniref:Cell division and transport-associated protein TolR n=1 Tax=Psittacicella gerlachiana TaxID=2028574 RepID=A0A3A1YCN8_9GAMM|nr:biopolymer transporter ExbD [Psittacicella gerlachiana]RIY34948.1 hypothetical protein CKF59_04395 [Psittacicella gerlachiana]